MRKARVLFVCTGNICRSPTAEAVLRKVAEAAGLTDRIQCDSAGMGDWHAGRGPDPRAVRAAAQRGYEMVGLRARMLNEADFAEFDLLIGMDSGHIKRLRTLSPRASKAKVALFLSFTPEIDRALGPDVPDPYTGGEADFEHVLDLIERGTAGLLTALRRDYL